MFGSYIFLFHFSWFSSVDAGAPHTTVVFLYIFFFVVVVAPDRMRGYITVVGLISPPLLVLRCGFFLAFFFMLLLPCARAADFFLQRVCLVCISNFGLVYLSLELPESAATKHSPLLAPIHTDIPI